jgi:Ca2+-binding RTX toxin-like protein
MCIFVGTNNNGSDPNTGLDNNTDDSVTGSFSGYYGLGGNDTMGFDSSILFSSTFMHGGEGNDVLNFNSGDVGMLFGDAGNDFLNFQGTGSSTLDGGLGDDTIWDFNSASYLDGGLGDDNIDAGDQNDTIFGGGGNDTIDPDDGNDLVYCGTGNDFIDLIDGNIGKDKIFGEAGIDTLNGGGGNDLLDGGVGNDLISGGLGRDTLTGGAGKDVFDYNSVTESGTTNTTRDKILDFQSGKVTTAIDKIDLSGIDAVPGGGDDSFNFITGAFTAAGQVRVVQSGADAIVQVNTVGAGAPEMTILLVNVDVSTITGLDFIL